MSYIRVIPRDLFNEADLLKCYGRLWIILDNYNLDSVALDFVENADGESFGVEQDESSGAIFISNVKLTVNGVAYPLSRPLNARAPWPLYCTINDDECRVFSEEGELSVEFADFIRNSAVPSARLTQ